MEKLKLRKEHQTIVGMKKSYLDPTHDFQANAKRLLVPGQQHEAHDPISLSPTSHVTCIPLSSHM